MREINKEIIEKIFEHKGEDIFVAANKFLSGRLLQAGWNSPSHIKYWGIKNATELGPLLRDRFIKILEESKHEVPKIYSDFLVLILSDFSFGSMFLAKQAKSLFENLTDDASPNNLYVMLFILWAIREFFTAEELKLLAEHYLITMKKIPNLPVEDEVRSYLFLSRIQKEDKEFVKMINRRLNKLKGRYADTFKKLLPHRRKGFR